MSDTLIDKLSAWTEHDFHGPYLADSMDQPDFRVHRVMTPQQRDAYIAEKLGIDGWKPGAMCQGCSDYLKYVAMASGDVFSHSVRRRLEVMAPPHPEHEIPPPNLRSLEGMSKLLIALADKSCEVIFQNYDGLQVCVYLNAHRQKVGDPPDGYGFDEHSWPDALADAAYDALEQDPK